MKPCRVCRESKPEEEFYVHSGNTCKQCIRDKARRWQQDNPKSANERKASWRETNRERNRGHQRRYYSAHRERILKTTKQARLSPERLEASHWAHILRKYKLTRAQWEELWISQGSKCGCCKSETTGNSRRWHTDHDHSTGKVRGILCYGCNIMLGAARDRSEVLIAGSEYLERTC